MTSGIKKKPEPSHIRGICVICNKNPQKKIGSQEKYKAHCGVCDKRLYTGTKGKESNKARWKKRYQPYREHLKDSCERCGFVPFHECQLDIHHKDEDHSNDDPENLETLCANCHRLQTYLERNPPAE